MSEQNGFKFVCPHCGQHLEAEFDMVGMTIDCPVCGQALEVPSPDGECQVDVDLDAKAETGMPNGGGVPKIAVLKRRESLTGRWKKRLTAIGIGIALLCLFIGVGIMTELTSDTEPTECGEPTGPSDTEPTGERKPTGPSDTEPTGEREPTCRNGMSSPTVGVNKQVLSSVEHLLDFLRLPNERRGQVLVDSLEAGPNDFGEVVVEYVVSVMKNPEDMISSSEKEEAMNNKVGAALLFGILGAASTGDSQRGVNAGLELGDMAYAELLEKARRRLWDEIERKRNRLIEVAQKYGIKANDFEEALVSHER